MYIRVMLAPDFGRAEYPDEVYEDNPLEATSDQGENVADEGGANLVNRPLSVYIQHSFTADLFHRPVFITVDGF